MGRFGTLGLLFGGGTGHMIGNAMDNSEASTKSRYYKKENNETYSVDLERRKKIQKESDKQDRDILLSILAPIGLFILGVGGMGIYALHKGEEYVKTQNDLDNVARQEVLLTTQQHFAPNCIKPAFCSQSAIDIFDQAIVDGFANHNRSKSYSPNRIELRENALRAVRTFLRETPNCYCEK